MHSKKRRERLGILITIVGSLSLLICGLILLIINRNNLSLVGNPSIITIECPSTLFKIVLVSLCTTELGVVLRIDE